MGWNAQVRDVGSYANEDRRWIKTLMGYDQCRSITLDVSTFDAYHTEEKGAIPSGTVLGIITATKKYGPYDDAAVDGRAVARGFLFNAVNLVTTPYGDDDPDAAGLGDTAATLYWGPGIIDQDYLPTFDNGGTETGLLDANGRADLTHLRFEGTDL